jgi:hypothetical protein
VLTKLKIPFGRVWHALLELVLAGGSVAQVQVYGARRSLHHSTIAWTGRTEVCERGCPQSILNYQSSHGGTGVVWERGVHRSSHGGAAAIFTNFRTFILYPRSHEFRKAGDVSFLCMIFPKK